MAVKIAIEPLFGANFVPRSFVSRANKAARMALSTIVQSINDGYSFAVDMDLKSYFDMISHELPMQRLERRIGDAQILRLVRAWLKAVGMEEGKATNPFRGSKGGVLSPLLSNIFLHEVDRLWRRVDGLGIASLDSSVMRTIRYLLAPTEQQAREAWEQLQAQFTTLQLVVNQEKTADQGERRIRVPGL